ncbi:hypothetical protein [Sphingobium sp. Ndbn-10]|uniref:acyltransferase n=1 Tax=Sphingobium sp. Ndbn-10 TaxID=1667223 RepID=UPI001112A377|nr:hypothetical protein [Sphingobium sp. Ndbn-10]
MSSQFVVQNGNSVNIGKNNNISGCVIGKGNVVEIDETVYRPNIDIQIFGDNNSLIIGADNAANGLRVRIGNHVHARGVSLKIGRYFTCEPDCQILLYNSGNSAIIGDECMFSNSIILRAGESPHLLFDKDSAEYLDVSEGVYIGDHVWVGERAYITKRVTVPNECVVAACAVITKRFDEENCVLAGNPARIVRRGIQWIRNSTKLIDGDKYHQSFVKHMTK